MINQSILSIERSISTQTSDVSDLTGILSGLYPRSNPSGYISGIENLVYTTGDQTISGVKIFKQGLQVGLDLDVSTLYVLSGAVGINNENPQAALDVSGSARFSERPFANGTGVVLIGEINTSNFYTNDNPSGFITGIDTSNFYTNDNPSGFITGIDTSNFYTNDNPSGFITGIDNLVYTTGDQTISGRKIFSDGIDAGLQVGISTLYVGSGLVGVNNEDPQAAFDVSGSVLFSQRPTVNGTGVMLSGDINSLSFYPNNNPSGFITGIQNLVYTTGDQTISGIKTFPNDVTILGNFAVSGTTYINEVIDVTTTGTISGVTGVFQHLEADNIVYSQTNSYVVAQPGDDLAAKYLAAKALRPNGSAKSPTNRASLIIFPGNYTLSAELAIDEEFVDVIGLGAQTQIPAVVMSGNTLNVSADNVRVSGISVGNQQFKISQATSNQLFENCIGGNLSFTDIDGDARGTFVNCVGGNDSFGGRVVNSGIISGTFINCSAGDYSFGGGIFSDCNIYSKFTNCIGGIWSFGGNEGGARGIFSNCTGGIGSFGGIEGSASGSFIDCRGGDYSFGGYFGSADGTFEYCEGGEYSFGGYDGVANGIFIGCSLTIGTFQTLTALAAGTARMINCIDGNGDIIEAEA